LTLSKPASVSFSVLVFDSSINCRVPTDSIALSAEILSASASFNENCDLHEMLKRKTAEKIKIHATVIPLLFIIYHSSLFLSDYCKN